ncbi:MAG: hypothetical protein FJ086_18930 [Deltaproteobacteria bacterium]|nr:hypothetical protein [Deltaproteobacteria bacterium]
MTVRDAAVWAGLLLFVPAAAQAQGYQRTRVPDRDVCLFWPVRQVALRAQAAGSARTPGETEFSALEAAVETWARQSRRCSDFALGVTGRSGSTQVGYLQGGENENLVLYRESRCEETVPAGDGCFADGSCGNAHNCWQHGEGILALTTTTYNVRTGTLVDGDVEMNAGPYLFTTVESPACAEGRDAPTCVSTDVQNTLTHELGHLVGFDHVEDPESTMAATAPPGELNKRLIDPGTGAGFCVAYPAGQPTPPCRGPAMARITAQSRGTAGCSAAGTGGVAWLLACLWAGGLCAGGRLGQR